MKINKIYLERLILDTNDIILKEVSLFMFHKIGAVIFMGTVNKALNELSEKIVKERECED